MKKKDISQNVFSEDLCNKIRTKLGLSEKELPNRTIRKTIILSNKLIGDWIVNNSDGFAPYRNCGNISVSKKLPVDYSDDKEIMAERIKKNKLYSDIRKEQLLRKLEINPNLKRDPNNFFYTFKILWFNRDNCDFRKADCYKFEPNKGLLTKLRQKIKEGKQYFEWTAEDFAKRGEDSVKRKKKSKKKINE